MKLDKKQRTELAKTLNDIAKLIIAALVIGQFVIIEQFNNNICSWADNLNFVYNHCYNS